MQRVLRPVPGGLLGLTALALLVFALSPAPAARADVPPCTRTGNLEVIKTADNTVIGFVSKTWNSFGEYVVTTTPSDYVSVSLTTGQSVNITALNPQNASFPLVGAITGFASSSNDLGAGSFNYAYLGGTTATAANATPQSGANAFTSATGIPEAIESAIWTTHDADQLVPQWVNTNGSLPATHLVDITGILVITGDTTVFQNTFGPADSVALQFVATSGPTCPPDLALGPPPASITTSATSTAGASVTYTSPTATDDEPVPVVCSPASGSVFPIGTTTVTCTATDLDDANSPLTNTFTVTVTDGDLGLTGVPGDISTSSTSSAGATVTYTPPTAIDEEPGATVSCTPASGSVFPIGTTTVTCKATDADDLNSPVSATFTVTVADNDLTISHPADITTDATTAAGATVTYPVPTVSDEDIAGLTPSCSPASGSAFPLGTTTVNCSVTDPGDTNSPATSSFGVTVVPIADLSLTKSATPNPAIAGQQITYTLTANNAGPQPAVGAKIVDPLPAGTTFEGASTGCANGAGTVTCTLGTLGSGATVTKTVVVISAAGSPANTATASSTTKDPNAVNNSATATTTVTSSCTMAPPGTGGSINVGGGQFLCATGGTFGAVTVAPGGALSLTNATVTGSISTNGAQFVTVCGSTVYGSVGIKNTSQFVRLGDDDNGCAGNHLNGSLTLANNVGGLEAYANTVGGAAAITGNHGASPVADGTPEVEGNHVGGTLSCSANTPPATADGMPNTAASKTGECAAL